MPVGRRLSPAMVVAIWGIANAVLIIMLVGFIAARSGPGLDLVLYVASATLVFGLALLAWLAQRRGTPLARGLRLPPRPATMLLLAAGAALAWLALPFGGWLLLPAVVPLAAALLLELAARRSSHG